MTEYLGSFGVEEVPPAGYVCRHGNGPQATKSDALAACPTCLAEFTKLRLVAPRSRSGRVWTPTGRYQRAYGFTIAPQGFDVRRTSTGGVRTLRRNLGELAAWEVLP